MCIGGVIHRLLGSKQRILHRIIKSIFAEQPRQLCFKIRHYTANWYSFVSAVME